jgi:DNA-binding transcriptional ArsR family regulator
LETDWTSLHKILSDTTRRSILELLAEKDSLTYTDMMTLLQVTNTGRLNYHLKALGSLILKDVGGKYRLTEQGLQAANLLRTFPERAPPERKLAPIKVATAVVLILIGILIVTSFGYTVVLVAGPTTAVTTNYAATGAQAIPQNTTIYLMGYPTYSSTFSMAWDAAGPVQVYVLNQTQYDALQFSRSSESTVLSNFTGSPGSWAREYSQQSGNVTVSLPPGEYHFYMWSPAPNYLDSFGLSQSQSEPAVGTSSLFFYLSAIVLVAIGALLIVLAASILTHRVWR